MVENVLNFCKNAINVIYVYGCHILQMLKRKTDFRKDPTIYYITYKKYNMLLYRVHFIAQQN